jgi:drug/metabolite transporter (DMT)-like permease
LADFKPVAAGLLCDALLYAGTAMVTLADGKYGGEGQARQSVLGDMLCLLSAVVYGMYTVSIRCGRWAACCFVSMMDQPVASRLFACALHQCR